jgi:hypothetical protein
MGDRATEVYPCLFEPVKVSTPTDSTHGIAARAGR